MHKQPGRSRPCDKLPKSPANAIAFYEVDSYGNLASIVPRAIYRLADCFLEIRAKPP